MAMKHVCLFFPLFITVWTATAQESIPITVTGFENGRPISPFIYGTNGQQIGSETAWRSGGNRMSLYNWENNASHAGADYFHQNDNFLTWIMDPAPADDNTPAVVYTDLQERANQQGLYTLLTLQMMGYVSRDKNGPVLENESAPNTSRWIRTEMRKPGAPASYTDRPDLNDEVVYIDELVHLMKSRFRDTNGVDAYALDNEPGLWTSTHPLARDISWFDPESGEQVNNPWWHPVGARELVARSIDMASMVREVDAEAEIFGPVLWGYSAFLNLQGARDWSTGSPSLASQYNTFIDYYLDAMKQASDSAGYRLLDVLDLHWYPQAEGVYTGDTDPASVERRLQAPRSLWDPTYEEPSWIIDVTGGPIQLIPDIKSSLSNYDPEVKLSFSEYDYGAVNHISGGIAQADVLGIFGREGVYFASKWGDLEGYATAGYRIFTDYDGAGGRFGSMALEARGGDPALISAYASRDEAGDRIHLILINKSQDNALNVTLSLDTDEMYDTAKRWYFDQQSTAIQEGDAVAVNGNQIAVSLPALSVSHYVFELSTQSTAVEKIAEASFYVEEAFPNPSGGDIQFMIEADHGVDWQLAVYDVLGREVLRENASMQPGRDVYHLSTNVLSAGRYLCRFVTNTGTAINRWVVIQ